MNTHRVLVCGGRKYGTRITEDGYLAINKAQVDLLNTTLDNLLLEFKNLIIIQGEAKGADSLAKDWAFRNKVQTLSFPANWKIHGKSAGFKRNAQMLEDGKPELVVAFAGGTGTKMMCDIAERADVEVRKIK